MTSRKNRTRRWLNFWGLIFFVVVIFFNAQSAGAESSFGSMSGYLDQVAKDPSVNLGAKPLPVMIGEIIYGILAFLGVISLLLVIYAGLKWMMADGNEETVSQAKKVIWYAIIGILIIMGSYAITFYVVNNIVNSTLQPNYGTVNVPSGPSANLPSGPSGGLRGGLCSGNGDCESGYECINGSCIPSRLDYYCNAPSDCAIYCSGTQTPTCENNACGCEDNYCDNLNCLRNCRARGYTSGYCDSGNNCGCT